MEINNNEVYKLKKGFVVKVIWVPDEYRFMLHHIDGSSYIKYAHKSELIGAIKLPVKLNE